jgi:hypothetical protein
VHNPKEMPERSPAKRVIIPGFAIGLGRRYGFSVILKELTTEESVKTQKGSFALLRMT